VIAFRLRLVVRILLAAGLAGVLAACAATPFPADTDPADEFRDRIQRQEAGGVRVSAAVPSAEESERLFGKKLYKKRIQPVWLKIENERDDPVVFLPVGLDPYYYSPLEVANLDVPENSGSSNLVNEFFMDQGMNLLVPAGESLAGFVFTNLDEGTKAFNVDIRGTGDFFETFTFFIPVPGLRLDHHAVDWKNLLPLDARQDLDTESLIEMLEQKAPCCVEDKAGKDTGDPLNLVIIGHPKDVYTTFIRAGWDETETVTRGSAWKTIKSFFSGGAYRYSPVSSLYVFGRSQDVAFQWIRDNIHERNHLRLWMSSYTYQDIPVWLGQISRDIGVRFTRKTITTHKIDPDVDDTREYLLENLAYAQTLEAFGYTGGVGEVSIDQPRGNLTGDPWFTDGYRLVLWLSAEPVPISEMRVLQWRNPREKAGVTE
jgi:hypothetical protein